MICLVQCHPKAPSWLGPRGQKIFEFLRALVAGKHTVSKNFGKITRQIINV